MNLLRRRLTDRTPERQVRRLPIVNGNGGVIGIVTMDDSGTVRGSVLGDSPVDAILAQLGREHFDLRRWCGDVERDLTVYRSRPGRASRRKLVGAVTSLARHLVQHFEFEEREGFLGLALDRAPAMASQIEHLRQDHEDLRGLAQRVQAGLERVARGGLADEETSQLLEQLLARLRDHEEAENELASRAFLPE